MPMCIPSDGRAPKMKDWKMPQRETSISMINHLGSDSIQDLSSHNQGLSEKLTSLPLFFLVRKKGISPFGFSTKFESWFLDGLCEHEYVNNGQAFAST